MSEKKHERAWPMESREKEHGLIKLECRSDVRRLCRERHRERMELQKQEMAHNEIRISRSLSLQREHSTAHRYTVLSTRA